MDSIWHDLEEIQTLSRIFLAVFVLIGLFPFFKKSLGRFFDDLNSLRRFRTPIIAPVATEPDAAAKDPSRLNDMEHLVFTHLAQTGAKGESLPAMAQSLHMESRLIAQTLKSLNQKGLVAIAPGFGIIKRLTLSKKGRALALEKGVVPRLS
ncbi:hypothetical protein SAMN05660860_00409 [Geoalkalibacter ferrihydriticus]|uniref:Uncharacterized protein n=2 Tax=Geoalkalibacter ferrihydriticus TaxID=392333 RepID=A0A0C2EEN6_9BACT|nr:hypothetical protein [Geoalkalibacter ferrihydriticus]KIH77088.1 hypothetical protein GFER_08650 [Geoalkalibacter ferrihydriticus DSM 17813]SDL35163.1 hypothetical protein SAMN05660860_00409 [Geoalkalibacter ferrihydriticus]